MIEKHVTSLELSKRLKELGVKQESIFYWTVCHDCTKEYNHEEYSLQQGENHGENISAFLASELFELLPMMLHGGFLEVIHGMNFGENPKYVTRYNDIDFLTIDESLPDSLAKMLIKLIEQKLITTEGF